MNPKRPLTGPDDPRHGTLTGYNRHGCRERCCRDAHNASKERRLNARKDTPARTANLGLHRRMEALQFLGWTKYALSLMVRPHGNHLTKQLQRMDVSPGVRDELYDLYDRLCMTIPTADTPQAQVWIKACIRKARVLRYAPPLAWDNIDNPDEDPRPNVRVQRNTPEMPSITTLADHVVVARILHGHYQTPANHLERLEVFDRWSGSQAELDGFTGWNISRDIRIRAEREAEHSEAETEPETGQVETQAA